MGKYIKDNFLPSENYRIKTVVIDPGHGGRDGGTSGKYAIEKNIVLKIAQKLGRNLQVQYPHIQILYTRQDDRFVSLKERARIANDNKADLFLSIHCNSLPPGAANSRVKGSETYVMGLHTAERNLEVAKRENASILYEQNYQQTYGGYDPNSPEGHIILSMYQNAFLQQSILLAEHIEKRMPRTWGRKSHGVKQAGFVVLKETTMPSVLIETGYLSNPDDERFLSSKEGQAQMALAILDAFSQYKHAIEDKASSATASNSSSTFVKNDTPPLRNNRPKTNNQTSPKFSGNKASKGISPSLLVQDKDNPSTQTIQKAKVEYKILLARTGKMADTSKAPWSEVEYSVQVTKENDTF
ncbi:MAG TPA: N-acetylmuramoyl-L-alanine amidase, partial [Phaeodactylibacter sp.]|nr:N-acetylmuramoyl-L-alanine amidase [Phaeodactylibacter sp.]